MSSLMSRVYKILTKVSLVHWFFIYLLSILSTYFLDAQIRENAGVSLVSDEGIYLAYSHMLAGSELSDLEQQHISDYGKFYWLRCLPLVFPASLLNRVGIEGIVSLRIIVWIIGFTGFYLFYKNSKSSKSRINTLSAIYFFLFPLGHMIRFFGIKETIISTNILLFFILVNKYYSKDLHPSHLIKNVGSRYILITALSFLFLQSYYVLVIVLTFAVFSIIYRSAYSAGLSITLFIAYLMFKLLSAQLVPNSDINIDITPTKRIIDIQASSGQSFIPKSVIYQVPVFLDNPKELKYLHLFYFNFSEMLSSLVSLESIMWLLLLGILTLKFLRLRRNDSPSQVILFMLCLISAGILVYDENLGTYLRHRDQILLSVLYFLALKHKKQNT